MNGSFSIIDNTAETGIQAEGSTVAELLECIGEGFISIYFGNPLAEAGDISVFELKEDSPEELIAEFLRNLILLIENSHLRICSVVVQEASETACTATVASTSLVPEDIEEKIKTVSPHDLTLEKTDSGYTIQIIFDV